MGRCARRGGCRASVSHALPRAQSLASPPLSLLSSLSSSIFSLFFTSFFSSFHSDLFSVSSFPFFSFLSFPQFLSFLANQPPGSPLPPPSPLSRALTVQCRQSSVTTQMR